MLQKFHSTTLKITFDGCFVSTKCPSDDFKAFMLQIFCLIIKRFTATENRLELKKVTQYNKKIENKKLNIKFKKKLIFPVECNHIQ